jgi:hypothetical protein
VAAGIGSLLELAQDALAPEHIDHQQHDQGDLGVNPAVARAVQADAVIQPQHQAENDGRPHQDVGEAVEFAAHHQQTLALGGAVSGHHGQVDENARQVEQTGVPRDHKNDVPGQHPLKSHLELPFADRVAV